MDKFKSILFDVAIWMIALALIFGVLSLNAWIVMLITNAVLAACGVSFQFGFWAMFGITILIPCLFGVKTTVHHFIKVESETPTEEPKKEIEKPIEVKEETKVETTINEVKKPRRTKKKAEVHPNA